MKRKRVSRVVKTNQEQPSTGKLSHILKDVRTLYSYLSSRRKYQLIALLILQVLSGFAEVISLGALIPFLSLLDNIEVFSGREDVKWVMNLLDISDGSELIVYASALFAATFWLVNIFRLLVVYVQTHLAAVVNSNLSEIFFSKVLFQNFEFHMQQNSSVLISRATHDLGGAQAVINNVLMILTQLFAVISLVIALVATQPSEFVLAISIVIFIYLFAVKINRYKIVKNGRIVSDKNKESLFLLQAGLGSIQDVIIGKVQSYFIKNYAKSILIGRLANARTTVLGVAPRYILEAMTVLILVAYGSSIVLSEDKETSLIASVGVFALAAVRIMPAIQTIYLSYARIQNSHASLTRALSVLSLEANRNDPSSAISVEKQIELRNVQFAYKDEKEGQENLILKGVDLIIPRNKTVALVGKTGSGKTTIANIILGLLEPTAGCFLVDGQPVKGANRSRWFASVANVPQHIFLLDASVKENIAFGVPPKDIDLTRVVEASKAAQLDEFIQKKPSKYDEVIGENGLRLSGGQRQRIGISRALYRNSPVVVFDEATSALDNKTEKDVMRALNNLKGEKTLVIIAHRLDTIKNADLIYEIDDGKVVASGTFSELLAESPSFEGMVSPQLRE